MFVFTYLPQAAVMAFTSGPLAAISAGLLVLSESSTLITILSKTFLIEDALIDTFDGTLMSKNTTDLLSEGRQIKAGEDPMAKLGKLLKKPLVKFTPKAMIRYLMYLPLNFIPVVGTVIFVLLQGKRAGPAAHTRYFQLKQWNKSQQEKHIEQYRGAYTGYGLTIRWTEEDKVLIVGVASEWLQFSSSSYLLPRSSSLSPTQSVRRCGLPTLRNYTSRRKVRLQNSGNRPKRRNRFNDTQRGIFAHKPSCLERWLSVVSRIS